MLALAACGSRSDLARNEMGSNEGNESLRVELPPSVQSSKVYRCRDNSLAYVDYLTDEITAQLRDSKHDVPVTLIAAAPGEPFVGRGYTLARNGETIELTRPTYEPTSCRT
jgi:hypothetical protein